jgi:hypothetical protein
MQRGLVITTELSGIGAIDIAMRDRLAALFFQHAQAKTRNDALPARLPDPNIEPSDDPRVLRARKRWEDLVHDHQELHRYLTVTLPLARR